MSDRRLARRQPRGYFAWRIVDDVCGFSAASAGQHAPGKRQERTADDRSVDRRVGLHALHIEHGACQVETYKIQSLNCIRPGATAPVDVLDETTRVAKLSDGGF